MPSEATALLGDGHPQAGDALGVAAGQRPVETGDHITAQGDDDAVHRIGGEVVDDFVTAVNTRTPPSVNAWVAARYTLPGVVAHESARQGRVRLESPDLGDAPER